VTALEDDGVIHASHHDRVKVEGSRICLATECKNILKFHILPAQKHQNHQRPFVFAREEDDPYHRAPLFTIIRKMRVGLSYAFPHDGEEVSSRIGFNIILMQTQ